MILKPCNHPNPFKDKSVITLTVPSDTKRAAINIYDISGKQVQTIPVSIPILCEYWRDYYMYGQPEVKTESRKLSASCTFHFGQLSDFEANYSRYAAENDQLEWKR